MHRLVCEGEQAAWGGMLAVGPCVRMWQCSVFPMPGHPTWPMCPVCRASPSTKLQPRLRGDLRAWKGEVAPWAKGEEETVRRKRAAGPTAGASSDSGDPPRLLLIISVMESRVFFLGDSCRGLTKELKKRLHAPICTRDGDETCDECGAIAAAPGSAHAWVAHVATRRSA